MRDLIKRTVPIGSLALLLSACFGADHPDTSRYEYLYMNGAFVAPYRRFPEGLEREKWQCYDGATKKTYGCTFVRGGFEHFQFIFRERT